jgi:hypothetical protein
VGGFNVAVTNPKNLFMFMQKKIFLGNNEVDRAGMRKQNKKR